MSESSPAGEPVSGSDPSNKDSLACPKCGKQFSGRSGLRYHSRMCRPEDLVSCPTCDKLYPTKMGVKLHHARVHDESLCIEEFECDNCGDSFEKYRSNLQHDGKFCSHECFIEHREGNWPGEVEYIEIECHNCGTTAERRKSDHSEESERTFCTHDCYMDWVSSEDNPKYKGGLDVNYGGYWETLRDEIVERDNYTCQACKTHKDELDTILDVHHLIPIDEFDGHEEANKRSNLVTYCRPCHREWEGIPVRPL